MSFAERVGDEPLGRQAGAIPIPARQPGAADVELADNADGHWPKPLVEDVESRVGDRPADRDRASPASTCHADDQTVVSVGP